MKAKSVVPVVLLLWTVVGATTAECAMGDLLTTISPPNPGVDEAFGYSLAADEAHVLVGVPRCDMGNDQAGAAYVFDGQTGGLQHTLQQPSPAGHDYLGFSVALVADRALVGAIYRGGNRGEAYLFDVHTGDLDRTLQAPAGGNFGYSVAGAAGKAIVGAIYAGTMGGQAYQFNCDTGDLANTFQMPGGYFGYYVAGMGEDVLVADPPCGAVHFFDGVTGQLQRTFLTPEPGSNDFFGCSVAAVGNNILVGAPTSGWLPGPNSGVAYLLDGMTGDVLLTLGNPNPSPGDCFGLRVAAVGTDLLVGANHDDTAGIDAGAAYLFDGTTGELLLSLFEPAPREEGHFGTAVAGMGSEIVVSSFWFHGNPPTAYGNGSVYVFEGVPEPATLALLAVGGAAMLLRRKA